MAEKKYLDYRAIMVKSMRAAMVSVLEDVAELTPEFMKDHAVYLTFNTSHPRSVVSDQLRAQYPEVITLVFQHRFDNMIVDHADREVRVRMYFGGAPCNIVIPFDSMLAVRDDNGIDVPFETEEGESVVRRLPFHLGVVDLLAEEPSEEPSESVEEIPSPEPKEPMGQVISLADRFKKST